jgi:hypothetical protein
MGTVANDPSPGLYLVVGLAGVFGLGPLLSRYFLSSRMFAYAIMAFAVGVIYVGNRIYNQVINARTVRDEQKRFNAIQPMIQAHPDARICPLCFQLEVKQP